MQDKISDEQRDRIWDQNFREWVVKGMKDADRPVHPDKNHPWNGSPDAQEKWLIEKGYKKQGSKFNPDEVEEY